MIQLPTLVSLLVGKIPSMYGLFCIKPRLVHFVLFCCYLHTHPVDGNDHIVLFMLNVILDRSFEFFAGSIKFTR